MYIRLYFTIRILYIHTSHTARRCWRLLLPSLLLLLPLMALQPSVPLMMWLIVFIKRILKCAKFNTHCRRMETPARVARASWMCRSRVLLVATPVHFMWTLSTNRKLCYPLPLCHHVVATLAAGSSWELRATEAETASRRTLRGAQLEAHIKLTSICHQHANASRGNVRTRGTLVNGKNCNDEQRARRKTLFRLPSDDALTDKSRSAFRFHEIY